MTAAPARLTTADYAMLERSYITRAVADAAGLYRVDTFDGRDLLGRKKDDCAGIVFSYIWPGEHHTALHRIRLDNPPVENGREQKYLTAHGSRNKMYPPPGCDPALLKDTSLPVVFTEGEKKCLALWRVALETGNGTGRPAFLPVSIPGVKCWHGAIGVTLNAKGGRERESGVIPDFDRIAWDGRKVIILFDANTATNADVWWERRKLASELFGRGANVLIADLPGGPGINGCDDFLGVHGRQALLEVLDKAQPWDWKSELLLGKPDKDGKQAPLGCLANAALALERAPGMNGVLKFCLHSLNIVMTRPTPWGSSGTWKDSDGIEASVWLQREHGIHIKSTHIAGEAALHAARRRQFHPVKDYLESLKWDGISRLDDWLTLYLGAEPSDYTRTVAAKWPISAVARVYDPGCKVDCVLILEGEQGAGKSTAVSIMAGEWFTDEIADFGNKDASMQLQGVWIMELGELDAMNRAEIARINSFVTRATDRFRPPYGRTVMPFPRQCIFAGTVNPDQYLRDATGARRFWPVKCAARIDNVTLRRDRDQIWAEALHRYKAGEKWYIENAAVMAAAIEEQQKRYETDAWEELILRWAENPKPHPSASLLGLPDFCSEENSISMNDLLGHCIGKRQEHWTQPDKNRIGRILRFHGWEYRLIREPGNVRVWRYRLKVKPV